MITRKSAPKPAPKPPLRPQPQTEPRKTVGSQNLQTNYSYPIRPDDERKMAAYQAQLLEAKMRAQAGQFDVPREGVGSISNGRILQQESDFYANNLNQKIVNQAKQEYLASLPPDRGYAQVLTPTRYGGTFGDARGSGFDKWFTENYINKGSVQVPPSPRDSVGPLPGLGAQNAQNAYNQFLQQGQQRPSIGGFMPIATPSNYDAMMAQQTYANLMRDQMAAYQAQMASASNSQFLPQVMPGGPFGVGGGAQRNTPPKPKQPQLRQGFKYGQPPISAF